ncbi:DNA polymerase Y family protein [Undibacterium sp. SXout20W]|uniref:DNA polymerase Y family protein n=1 Tax=Undibacterium sp. SXout20W TaxID=3413051 RepID=UPI003BF11DB9
MTNKYRRIAHLDMDAFYASVELLKYPELRGQPVLIGGDSTYQPSIKSDGTRLFSRVKDYVGRGVATTTTYEARALGLFSAMGIMKAARVAPDVFLLPPDFDLYLHYSRLFKDAVRKIAPKFENRGIDEIYIDLTDHNLDTLNLAKSLKNAVFEATGLNCSICVAPNKLLAKIGSDLEKPNGLTILTMDDLQARIWPLSVKKINGIGPKAAERLAGLSIGTVGELANADPSLLQDAFGSNYAGWLCHAAHGIDNSEVITNSEPKVISREVTFDRDLHAVTDRSILTKIFTDLCYRLADNLKKKGYVCSTVGIKIRYCDFRISTRDITLSIATADPVTIRKAATECLRRVPLDHRFRLLGVKASVLLKAADIHNHRQVSQGVLFPDH